MTERETAQLQVQCDFSDLAAVVRVIRKAHPYEVPTYEVPMIEAWRLKDSEAAWVGAEMSHGWRRQPAIGAGR